MPLSTLKTISVPVIDITVDNNRRHASQKRVQAIADSLLEIGLLEPIGITKDRKLVYGRHRYEAYLLLGWDKIPSVVVNLDDLRIELAEIDENLQRSQLTAVQEAKALKRRKEIYEELHPETRVGAHGGGKGGKGTRQRTENDKMSFSADTAAKTGKSARTIERAVKTATDIAPDVLDAIENTPTANNKGELAKLAALSETSQREVAKLIASGEAQSVTQALITPCKQCGGREFNSSGECIACAPEPDPEQQQQVADNEAFVVIEATIRYQFSGRLAVASARLEALAEKLRSEL